MSQEIHEGAAMSAAAFAIYPMRRDVQTYFISAMPEPDAVLAGMAAVCGLACLAARAGMRRSSA